MTTKTQIKIVRPWPAEQPRPPVVKLTPTPANDHPANDHKPQRKS